MIGVILTIFSASMAVGFMVHSSVSVHSDAQKKVKRSASLTSRISASSGYSRVSMVANLNTRQVSKPTGYERFKDLVKKNLTITESLNACWENLPTRFWNFYVDSLLIPAYRPEWGEYQKWTFKAPNRSVLSEEERAQLKMDYLKKKYQEIAKRAVPKPVPHDHMDCKRVKFNISGRIFETQIRTLAKYPQTLLGNPKKLQKFYDAENRIYFFDRNPASFEAILYFYQSGGYLRRPEDIHLDTFYGDAEFYQLPHNIVQKLKVEEGIESSTVDHWDALPHNLLQRKFWLLFDCPESSPQARILAVISLFAILISIISFCIETIPNLDKTGLYSKFVDTEGIVQTADLDLNIRDPIFMTETSCSLWFSLEFTARLLSCPNKIRFIKTLDNIIDFVAVAPYYFQLFTSLAVLETGTARHSSQILQVVRVFRLVRVFRIFKLSRHSNGLKILGRTLQNSASELMLLIFFVFLGVILFSSAMYFAESKVEGTNFTSIPHGFWYTVVTMTTVGYGEVVPRSTMGKVVGTLCAVAGVLTIALPVPVIVSNFNYFYHLSIGQLEISYTHLHHVPQCPNRSKVNAVSDYADYSARTGTGYGSPYSYPIDLKQKVVKHNDDDKNMTHPVPDVKLT